MYMILIELNIFISDKHVDSVACYFQIAKFIAY